MKINKIQALIVSALLLLTAGCGGGGSQSLVAVGLPQGLIAAFSSPTVDAGQTIPIVVSVVNDTARAGATITLSGPGTLTVATPTYSGTSTFYNFTYVAPATATAGTSSTITATSVNTPSQVATLTINLGPAIVVTTTALPNGSVASPYNALIVASGGTGTLTATLSSGTLPAGLILNPVGAISGTPTTAGVSTFTLTFTDKASIPNSVTRTYSITILPTPPSITTLSLPNAVVLTPYSQQLAFTGGGGTTPTFAITAGSLPASSGLTLSSSGLISGTPPASAAGTAYTFSVAVTVGTQTSVPVTYTLTIPALPMVTTTSLPSGNIGIPYSQQLTYSGGNGGAVTFAIVAGSLPAGSGLTLSPSGLLAGKPTVAAVYTFSVAVTVGTQTSAPQPLTLTINSVIITSGPTAAGEVGLPFQFRLSGQGGTQPYTYSLAAGSAPLPAGLTLNATSGLITGTPTSATGSPFTNIVIKLTDAVGATATQAMTFTISPARTAANNALLTGSYAFLLTGADATGAPLLSAGSFTADGKGNILTGVFDANGTALAAEVTSAITGGAYSVGADNRGKLTLTSASGTATYVIAMNTVTAGVASAGTLTEFDQSLQIGTGTLSLQTPAAVLTGGYAFGLQGFAANGTATARTHRGDIGEIQLGPVGTFTSAEYLAAGSAGTAPIVPISGSISVAANGRGTLSLVTPNNGTLNLIVYVVSPAKFYLLSADPASGAAGKDLLAGQGLQQTIASGSFSNTSLNGSSVLRARRLATTLGGAQIADAEVGVLGFNSTGNVTLAADENAGGTVSSNAFAGTYSVAPNGRVTVFLSAVGLSGCSNCVSVQTFFYLVAPNQGFVLDFSSGVLTGAFEPQTAAPTFAGSYTAGTLDPLVATANTLSGVVVSNGAGVLTTTQDRNTNGTLTPDFALTETYTAAANGRVLTSLGRVLYLISPTRAVLLDLGTASPTVQEIVQ